MSKQLETEVLQAKYAADRIGESAIISHWAEPTQRPYHLRNMVKEFDALAPHIAAIRQMLADAETKVAA